MRLHLSTSRIAMAAMFICGLALPPNPVHAADAPRHVTSIDADWRFHRGDLTDAAMGKPINAWRWKADDRGETSSAEMAAPDLKTDSPGWKDAKPGDNVFQGRKGFAWFRTELPAGSAKPTVYFDSVDDNATVYLNGKRLTHHEGWSDPFEVPLADAWKADGSNTLAVLVQNTDGGGGMGKASLEGTGVNDVPPSDSPRSPTYDDSSWDHVDVPHDYVDAGTDDPKTNQDHGFLPVEPAWYRKTIAIPAVDAGRRIWLEFDGIYRNSRMWLNGKYLGRHPSGYGSFRYDVTDAAKTGADNLLTVRVDPTAFEGWFYEGGGIYRHVRMVSLDPVHIAPWGVYANAKVADPGDGVTADADLTVNTTVANQSDQPVEATVISDVVDAAGNSVAQLKNTQQLAVNSAAEISQQTPMKNAHLWSLENTYLYQVRTTVTVNDKPVDNLTTTFGVRHIRFDADKGFFLNGKPVKLKGTSNHQDFAGVGSALPDRLFYYRIERLKEMGDNAYRCAHNPVATELLDACDKLGMLVMDENRHLGDTYSAKTGSGTGTSDLSDLSDLILRDRNHPSVIMWSICNEEPLQGSAEGGRIAAAMMKKIHALDTTRPISAAMNGGHGGHGAFTDTLDLEGFNYGPGGYDGFHKAYPHRPMFGSETASEVGTRGIYDTEHWDRYWGNREKGYVSAYGINAPPWAQTAEDAWRPIAQRPFVAGGFAWTGFDYKGEPTPFGWPCINSHFGIMDMCGFPKDSYYYYQAWWTDQPILHLFPHWNWKGKEGQTIDVWVQSNCQHVELFLNGTSQGAKDMKPYSHLAWKVKYEPGTLLAKGTRDGKEYTAKVETTNDAAAIALEPDRKDLTADGADVSVVVVKIFDDQGRLMPTADNDVAFTVTGAGKILGVGNGDPSSHESDKASRRKAFNGLCMLLVQTTKGGGTITVTAEAAGLKRANVALMAK